MRLIPNPHAPGAAVGLAVLTAVLAAPAGAQQPVRRGLPPGPDTLTLDAAVQFALAWHPALRLAEAGVHEAAALTGQAAGDRFPQLGLTGSLIRYQEPTIIYPLHGFDPANPPPFETELLQGSVSVSYALFDGGARGGRIRSARAGTMAAEARADRARQQVAGDVVQAYLAVLSTGEVLASVRSSLDALAAERRRVRQFFEEGRAARVEVLRVEGAVAAAEAERISAESEHRTARDALARVLGLGAGALGATAFTTLTLRDTTAPGRDAALAAFEARSLDLDDARARHDAAVAQARVARAAWFPRVDLVGGYLGFGSVEGHFAAEWQAGVRLSYPLFTGGARSGAAAAAAARAEQAEQQYRMTWLAGAQQVDRAVARVEEQHARVAAIAVAAAHATEVARIERVSLESGAGTEADYLRAEADSRATRARLVEARYTEIGARVELARLTGSLTPDVLSQLVETAP
jgi:outer membrane protein TolC